ncbi:MAG: hypothetical protein ACYS99_11265 [Planctomycetota bacterium]
MHVNFLILLLLIVGIAYAISKAARKRHAMAPSSRLEAVEEMDLDMGSWWEFAEGMGLRFRAGPLVRGEVDGRRVRMEVGRIRGLSTRLQTFLETPLEEPVTVHPRETDGGDPDRVPTGDEAFDSEFDAACRSPSIARRVLAPKVKEWLLALADVELAVTGTVVTAKVPGFEKDLLRLRGLLEVALEAARAAEAPEEAGEPA